MKQLAEHMVADHGSAEAKLKSLDAKAGITPREGSLSEQVKQGGERVMASLRAGTASDLDKTYVDAQVEQHQKVLGLIDRFIPQVQNADLKSLLQENRKVVATHLRHAQELQTSLAK